MPAEGGRKATRKPTAGDRQDNNEKCRRIVKELDHLAKVVSFNSQPLTHSIKLSGDEISLFMHCLGNDITGLMDELGIQEFPGIGDRQFQGRTGRPA
jgi:hypothetical protein